VVVPLLLLPLLVEVVLPPAPPAPPLVLLHAPAATALAAVSPRSTATAVRERMPSSRRSGWSQVGQWVSHDLAWQAQLGHTIKVGGMRR
jgi:hypothetical protein